jgi:CubicO group peptidase (beta-lactamase class C family)
MWSGLERTVAEVVRSAPMPAVGVSVFDRERVLVSTVSGVADLTSGRPVEPDDWWDLASLTKVLVTLPEVLSLAADGRLDLDRPLGTVWPAAAGRPVGVATTRQLLAHDAGLPATLPLFRTWAGRDAVVSAALAAELERPPGSGAVYSDIGFLLLGEVVREFAGADLPELAGARTGLRFAPLPGSAVATERCAWRGRLITGEVHDENAAAMGGVAGHAGAFGTLALVTAAARAWFADAVLPAASHRAARACWSTNADGERFGLGWWLTPTRGLGGTVAGPRGYGCSGFVGNRIWLEPDRGYGVVVLSNRVHPLRGDREPFAAWCERLLAALALTMTDGDCRGHVSM